MSYWTRIIKYAETCHVKSNVKSSFTKTTKALKPIRDYKDFISILTISASVSNFIKINYIKNKFYSTKTTLSVKKIKQPFPSKTKKQTPTKKLQLRG